MEEKKRKEIMKILSENLKRIHAEELEKLKDMYLEINRDSKKPKGEE